MAVIAGRTRVQLEEQVGYALGSGAIFVGSWTSNGSGTGTINTDTKWKGNADRANGMWLHATSGGETGEIVRVTGDNGSGQLTHDALSGDPSSGETYILWDERYRPDAIYSLMNDAILDLYGRVYDEIEDVSLHSGDGIARFDIPSTFSSIREVGKRVRVPSVLIHNCDAVWDETTDSDFTQSVDTVHTKTGTSLKVAIAAGASANDLITDSIESVDLSDMTHLEYWVFTDQSTNAAEFKLHLHSSTVTGSSDLETFQVPALADKTWTFVRTALTNPEDDTAIVSVGLEYVTDVGAMTIYLDDIRCVNNDKMEFAPLPRRQWTIDKANRALLLKPSGVRAAGYALLKLKGGDKPALLTADATVNEVPEDYLIAKTVATALESFGPSDDRTAIQLSRWGRRSEMAYRRLPMMTNIRETE
jgi:hypothetical protein